MLRNILIGVFVLAAFGTGAWIMHKLYQNKQEELSRTEATVILDKVNKVCKLVTVEGNFTEIYDETNIRQFTIYMPLPSTWKFSKKAILKVDGKVLVGYDMKDIIVTVDSNTQRIVLSNLPEPEILSIDHEVKYENLEESWFNSFSAEDFTNLNKNAKEVLRQKALESRLMDEARQQGNQILEVIRFMTESAGWELTLREGTPFQTIDSLLN